MNLGQLKVELDSILRDVTVQQSFTTWLNEAVLELAAEYEIPALRLRKPAELVTSSAEWLYRLDECTHPDGYVYHKKVFRVSSEANQTGMTIEPETTCFDDIDLEHTDTGDNVQRVAVEGHEIAVYPLASDTLKLWFFRRPFDMVDDEDVPDGIDEAYHRRVLLPPVVLMAFRVFPNLASEAKADTATLRYWQNERDAGLYGDGNRIGWVNALQKQRGARTRGPRLGSNVGGGGGYWPVRR